MCILNGYKQEAVCPDGNTWQKGQIMNILKSFYYTLAVLGNALFLWASVSYIDALINPLRQSWNFWDLLLTHF